MTETLIPTPNAELLLTRGAPDVYGERPEVAAAVQEAAVQFAVDLIGDGRAFVALEPGDATRYELTALELPVPVGNRRGGARLFVYNDRAVTMSFVGLQTPAWIMERLELSNGWTAHVLALFLTTVCDIVGDGS